MQGLPPVLTRPIVPFLQTVHDRAGIEIQRGCTQGCRFCQAGMIYRPLRERTPEEVVAAARDLFANTGQLRILTCRLQRTGIDIRTDQPFFERWLSQIPGFGACLFLLTAFLVSARLLDIANIGAILDGARYTFSRCAIKRAPAQCRAKPLPLAARRTWFKSRFAPIAIHALNLLHSPMEMGIATASSIVNVLLPILPGAMVTVTKSLIRR